MQTVPSSDTADYGLWDEIMDTDPKTTALRENILIKIAAYSFGDRFLAPSFQQEMIGAIVGDLDDSCIDQFDLQSFAEYAFKNVPSHNPILHLLVDKFCEDWKEAEDEDKETALFADFPTKFILRALRRFSELKNMSQEEKDLERCYYEHETDDEKS